MFLSRNQACAPACFSCLSKWSAMAEKSLKCQICQESGRYDAPGTYRICKLRITRYGINCNTYNGIYIIDSGSYLWMVKGKDKTYTLASEEIFRNRQTLVKPLVDSYFAWENTASTLLRWGKVPAPVRCCTVPPKNFFFHILSHSILIFFD